MSNIRTRCGVRKNAALPLFVWADAREHSAYSLPAIVLARRFSLSPQRARLVAELAGLGDRR